MYSLNNVILLKKGSWLFINFTKLIMILHKAAKQTINDKFEQ